MDDKKPFPSELQDRIMVRLPDGMRDRIAEEAKAAGRTMNSEVVLRLQDTFEHAAPLPTLDLLQLRHLRNRAERLAGQVEYVTERLGVERDEAANADDSDHLDQCLDKLEYSIDDLKRILLEQKEVSKAIEEILHALSSLPGDAGAGLSPEREAMRESLDAADSGLTIRPRRARVVKNT